jgi:malate dehydrogenase
MMVRKKVKVSIVGGGGVVGSAAAYRIAQDGLASEIVLVDVNRNLAEAHALDIDQAVAYRAATRIYTGDINDTKNSDLVLVTVTGPRPPSLSSRSQLLPTNLPLIIELMEPLLAQSPSAIWFLTTAPVDPLVYLVHRIFSIPRHKIIGLNWNDSSRFCWAIARILSVPCSAIEAFVIGEHGETQVPLFSLIRIHGEKISLDPDQKDRIRSEIEDFLPHWTRLKPGRTAGWTTAESIGGIFKSIVCGDGKIWVCSTPLEGEYGLSEVSLGVPVKLGPEGVSNIVEFDLDPEEKKAFEASVRLVKSQIQAGQSIPALPHRKIAGTP